MQLDSWSVDLIHRHAWNLRAKDKLSTSWSASNNHCSWSTWLASSPLDVNRVRLYELLEELWQTHHPLCLVEALSWTTGLLLLRTLMVSSRFSWHQISLVPIIDADGGRDTAASNPRFLDEHRFVDMDRLLAFRTIFFTVGYVLRHFWLVMSMPFQSSKETYIIVVAG